MRLLGLGFFLFFTPLWYFLTGVLRFILHFSETVDSELLVFNKTSASGKNWQLSRTHKGISEKLFVIPKLDAARVHNSKTSFLMGKAYKTKLNNGEISWVYLHLEQIKPSSPALFTEHLVTVSFFFLLIKLHVCIPKTAEVLCYA